MGTRMSGRRVPRQSKIIRGTFRHDRNPEDEPEPTKVETVPAAPKSLGKIGRELWGRLAAELVEHASLSVVDLPALEILCSAYEMSEEARAAIYRPRGRRRTLAAYLKDRPPRLMAEWTVMRSAWAVYRQYAVEFGLTLSSRNRIDLKPPKPPEVDPMEALLSAP